MNNWFNDVWGNTVEEYKSPTLHEINRQQRFKERSKQASIGNTLPNPFPRITSNLSQQQRASLSQKREKLRNSLDPTSKEISNTETFLKKVHPQFDNYTNDERYRIVDEFMANNGHRNPEDFKQGYTSNTRIQSTDPNTRKFTPIANQSPLARLNAKGRPNKPYTKNDIKLQQAKKKVLEGTNNFTSWYKQQVKNLSASMPNEIRDIVTASNIGVQTKKTTVGKIGGIFGASEVTGHNPITGESINIDYLSNKIGKQQPFNESTGNSLSKFFKRTSNNMIDRIGQHDLENWKKMHIEETSKSVRPYGANIDPFNTYDNPEYLKRQARVEGLKQAYKKEQGINRPSLADIDEAQKWASSVISNNDRALLKEKYLQQMNDLDTRIATSQSNIKQFGSAIDHAEHGALTRVRDELAERVSRIDKGYGVSQFNTNDVSIPKSVKESFEELDTRRRSLYAEIHGGQNAVTVFPDDVLARVNRELGEQADHYNKMVGFNGPSSHTMGEPLHTKTYRPTFGTSGYGLGFMNSMSASGTEHLARGLHYLNPFGAGGASGLQAIKEGFGIMNRQQRMLAEQARGFGKIPHALVPGIALAQISMGMYNKEDAGQITEDMFAMGTSLAGWRVGSAFGGAFGSLGGNAGKFLGLGIGGLTGMALGYGAGVALVGGVRDIISNESQIRSFTKKAYTKEATVSQVNTRQSLTMRQQSLNQLARSGLNDRGLLLGNEATILATGG